MLQGVHLVLPVPAALVLAALVLVAPLALQARVPGPPVLEQARPVLVRITCPDAPAAVPSRAARFLEQVFLAQAPVVRADPAALVAAVVLVDVAADPVVAAMRVRRSVSRSRSVVRLSKSSSQRG